MWWQPTDLAATSPLPSRFVIRSHHPRIDALRMEAAMRLTASDFMTYWRPSVCELRVFLHEKGEPEPEPGAFDEVMRRLGIRHEQEHLATLGPYLDLSDVPFDERVGRTLEAIVSKTPVIYQPAFAVRHRIADTDVEIVGAPDFLI